jgi:hypothetical protein
MTDAYVAWGLNGPIMSATAKRMVIEMWASQKPLVSEEVAVLSHYVVDGPRFIDRLDDFQGKGSPYCQDGGEAIETAYDRIALR